MQKTCLAAALALASGALALAPVAARAQDPAPAADAAAAPATTETTTTTTDAAAPATTETTTTTADAPAADAAAAAPAPAATETTTTTADAPAADATVEPKAAETTTTTTTTETTSADAAPAAADAPAPDPAAAEATATAEATPGEGFFKRTIGVRPYIGYNYVLNNISTSGAIPVTGQQKTSDPKGQLHVVRLGFQITDNVALEGQGGFAGKRRGEGTNGTSGNGTAANNAAANNFRIFAETGGGGYIVFSTLAFDLVELRFPIGYAAYKTEIDGPTPTGAAANNVNNRRPTIKGVSYGAELGLPLDKVFTSLASLPSLSFTAGGMFYGRAREQITTTVNGATTNNDISFRLYGVQFGVRLTFQ